VKFDELLAKFAEQYPKTYKNNFVPSHPDMNKTDLRKMYDFIISTPAGCIVEIGVDSGCHASYMGAAAQEVGKKMYLIDPWGLPGGPHSPDGIPEHAPKKDECVRHLERMGISNYEIIHNFSQFVAKDFLEPISFIFIDGCHCGVCVKADADMWIPKVVNGGVVMFHDAGWATITPVLINHVNKWPGIEPVNMDGLYGNQSQPYIIHK
jgi:hypothetical protein